MAIEQEIDKFEEKFTAGMENGIKKRAVEMAKNMLNHKVSIEEIQEFTGLPIGEIKKLKAEI